MAVGDAFSLQLSPCVRAWRVELTIRLNAPHIASGEDACKTARPGDRPTPKCLQNRERRREASRRNSPNGPRPRRLKAAPVKTRARDKTAAPSTGIEQRSGAQSKSIAARSAAYFAF